MSGRTERSGSGLTKVYGPVAVVAVAEGGLSSAARSGEISCLIAAALGNSCRSRRSGARRMEGSSRRMEGSENTNRHLTRKS